MKGAGAPAAFFPGNDLTAAPGVLAAGFMSGAPPCRAGPGAAPQPCPFPPAPSPWGTGRSAGRNRAARRTDLPELQRGDDHEDEAAEAEAGPIAVRQARVGLALQQLQQHGPPAAATTATRAGSALHGAARLSALPCAGPGGRVPPPPPPPPPPPASLPAAPRRHLAAALGVDGVRQEWFLRQKCDKNLIKSPESARLVSAVKFRCLHLVSPWSEVSSGGGASGYHSEIKSCRRPS